jgi:hypothetical protein
VQNSFVLVTLHIFCRLPELIVLAGSLKEESSNKTEVLLKHKFENNRHSLKRYCHYLKRLMKTGLGVLTFFNIS